MPITNNLIKINNIALRPAPKFNLTYETFKSGEYIIGGVLKVSINGEIYASSINDLNSKIASLSAYSGTCQALYIECDSSVLINGTSFINSVSFTPTDQPFIVNYAIDIEVSDSEEALAIKTDEAFISLYGLTIPSDIILKTYEESLILSSDESLGNTFFYVDGSYTKASLKLSGQISIQTYHHMCDVFSAPDLTNRLYTIINSRIQKLLSLDSDLSTVYPALDSYTGGGYTALNDNKNISISNFDNKIDFKFDLFIVIGDCHPKGIVDLVITETTDQTTALSSWSIKGSIKGLSDATTTAVNNHVISNTRLSNARDIYNDLENKRSLSEYGQFEILGCTTSASLPSSTCYQRISAQITENFNGGQIDFEMSYGDIETCQIGGSNIDINIQEEYPTNKYVEHIIPGRGTALVQIGSNLSPFKATITASGKLNSCDTTLINTLISCVDGRFLDIINSKGYNNYILAKESKTIGKYSYKISRSYIECI